MLTPDDAVGEFAIQNKSTGNYVARLDPTWAYSPELPEDMRWPTLYLAGVAFSNEDPLSPQFGAFKIGHDEGGTFKLDAYIDIGGNLHARGRIG